MRLSREFFLQPTPEVARQLLGKLIISRLNYQLTAGRIVETEAYLGSDDPAAHSFRGQTERNKVMFGEPGHAYVYFSYGVHTCLNTVTAPVGTGHGVLIRAIEPLVGESVMMKRRGRVSRLNLCSGPGKLTQALAINLACNGKDLLTDPELFLADQFEEFKAVPPVTIIATPRIGLSKAVDLPYRFIDASSQHISHPNLGKKSD